MASLTIADLLSDRKPITLPVYRDAAKKEKIGDVQAVYRPSAIDLESEAKSRELRLDRQGIRALAEELHHALIEWDLLRPALDADGKPIKKGGEVMMEPEPITVETLGKLGYQRLRDWNTAITDDMFPNVTSVESSDAGSFQ